LGNISEKYVDHTDQHTVFVGETSVLYNRDDVRSFFGNIDQISARSGRKLYGVNQTGLKESGE
jgi:hypothetical protein